MNEIPFIAVSIQVSVVAMLALISTSVVRGAAHRHSILLAALLCILTGPIFYAATVWTGFSINLAGFLPSPRQSVEADQLPSVHAWSEQPVIRPESVKSFRDAKSRADLEDSIRDTPRRLERASQDRERAEAAKLDSSRAELVFSAIWLLGSVFFLAGVFRSQWKAAGIVSAARPMSRVFDADVIADAEKFLGLEGQLRIATTGRVAGPVVVGAFQPWILIPARYLEALSRGEILQVLIHEGAHVLRRDPLVALLQRISVSLFWWNPLVHLVSRRLTRAREEVCDNFVLTHAEPETYGATLLRLATLSPAMARFSAAVGIFDDRGQLEARIRGLFNSRRTIMTRVRWTTGTSVLLGFAFLSVLVRAHRPVRVGVPYPDQLDRRTQGIRRSTGATATRTGTQEHRQAT